MEKHTEEEEKSVQKQERQQGEMRKRGTFRASSAGAPQKGVSLSGAAYIQLRDTAQKRKIRSGQKIVLSLRE